MFLREIKSKGKTYLNIIQGYREGGKVKQKSVISFGCIDKLNKEQLKKLGSSLIKYCNSQVLMDVNTIEEKSRKNWGAVRLLQKIWKMYDLSGLINHLSNDSKIEFDVCNTIFLMLIDRLLDPKSKLKSYEEQKRYYEVEDVELHHLYRALDFLYKHKEEIEIHLFEQSKKLFNLSVDVVLYDVTTLYFESNHSDELRNFGYSKDCKFNEVQVVLSLLVDREGIPIGFELYEGKKFEGKTLIDIIEKVKNKFKINKIIFIADQGMLSKDNLTVIKDNEFEYIIGSRIRSKSKKIKEQVLNAENYITVSKENEEIFKYKEIEIGEDKIICSWSKKRANKDRKDRARLLLKAEKLLKGGINKLITSRGAGKYIDISSQTTAQINNEKIQRDEQWDGYFAIQTNSKINDQEKLLEYYHQLWKVEESFRLFKSHLETRPMFHWNSSRINGHMVLCFLSFLFERTLEFKLRQNSIEYSADKIRQALNSLEFSEISIENKTFYLRAPVEGLAYQLLKIFNIRMPKSMSRPDEF